MLRSRPPTSSERATCATLSAGVDMMIEVVLQKRFFVGGLLGEAALERDRIGIEGLELEHSQENDRQALGAFEECVHFVQTVGEGIREQGFGRPLERFG